MMDYIDCYLRPKIQNYLADIVNALTNDHTRQSAIDIVPIGEIVQNNLEIVEKNDNFNDNLLPHLVNWFSDEFFQWFSPPDCLQCSQKLEYYYSSTSPEGLIVEHYRCNNDTCCDSCRSSYQFIRHNDPAILLTTRQGRCGEWAMCFLVILKALNYDARIVLDTTDHVWNEVWSEDKQKWIHVDSCESVIDRPLLYEIGWGKRLEYCIALSNHEVIDVTPRYSRNFAETLKHRPYCDLKKLEGYLDDLTRTLLESEPRGEIKSLVHKRRDVDLAFLKTVSLNPQKVDDDVAQIGGRKTGSIQWRIQRGEYNPTLKNSVVIKIKQNPMTRKEVFSFRYRSDGDFYDCNLDEYKKKKWSSLVYLAQNIDFKYERDWKCSYLSRYETCEPKELGIINWRFDVSDIIEHEDWKDIDVKLCGMIYPNTNIQLNFSMIDDTDVVIFSKNLSLNAVNNIKKHELSLNRSSIIQIEVQLRGGDDEDRVAWQKPQIFRQSKSSLTMTESQWPFEIKFH